ncbi:MAG: hypothetical protein ABR907_09995 [Terracidiphilus sp.]|jgi:hypothetical protein
MVVFERSTGGLYLTQADITNPAAARVGFLFQDSNLTDPSFELTPASWANPALQGYFAFFSPSATRDWSSFATAVRAAFVAVQGAQFAWFDESSGAPVANTVVVVSGQGTSNPTLGATAAFANRNVTVSIVASPFAPVGIAWDDANNQFAISNPSGGGSPAVQLAFDPISGGTITEPSLSTNLTLPLTGGYVGCINSAYQLSMGDLDGFEAGCLYFAPPPSPGQQLTSLRYPLFRGAAGSTAPFNFNFWFDVLNATDPLRTFFQATDPVLGSYFAAANGDAFALNTNASGATATLSRLVFSNRPVQAVTDSKYYYLAPAGQFTLAIDSGSKVAGAVASSTSNLLCGITGTEFFAASVLSQSPDTVTFIPGQAAYASGNPADITSQLVASGGSTVTSWIQFATRKGSYVSQPEQSPLFQQSATSRVSLGGNDGSNGTAAHILDFLPLATWAPNSNNGLVSTPAVPMVPYAGIPANADLSPFLAMETAALNPTRKNNMSAAPHSTAKSTHALSDAAPSLAMTPQGMLAVLSADTPPVWTTLQMAISAGKIMQFTTMGPEIRSALQQNQIFAVISTLTGPNSQPLFGFAGTDQQINISDWVFSLSPAGTPSPAPANVPPIVILKFYDGQSIEDLVKNIGLWSSPDDFNNGSFPATSAQQYIEDEIDKAAAAVKDDPDSLFANFYSIVTDPNFAGILALNCNLQLNELPSAIQAVLGGMTRQENGVTVSNVDQFRAHHVGIQINNTDPNQSQPAISQSSLFALVDYEKPAAENSKAAADVSLEFLGFEVEYLRALFTNSELRSFACQLNLTINNLFGTGVTLESGNAAAAAGSIGNVIEIQGSYQNHSGGASEGQGVYSFVAEGEFEFDFAENQYLDKIALTKLQFSFQQSSGGSTAMIQAGATTNIQSRFSIWGSLAFKELKILDIFAFEKLSFADLGIDVSFDLQLSPPPPVVSNLELTFSPGDLRLDLAQSEPREGDTSLLSLLPFRLKSFLYSQNADQTLDSLDYFSLGGVPGLSSIANTFNYALLFDLDLGSAGALVGSLAAFKFSFLIGWLSGENGGVAFGVQMPEADGKLEIKIQGILDLIIEEFVLQYVNPKDGGQRMLVVGLHNTSIEILGQRMPPEGNMDFALFKPLDGDAQIGWIVAYNNEDGQNDNGGGDSTSPLVKAAGGASDVLNIKYLGLGQRVGPDPTTPPTNFADFLEFMTTGFWTAFSDKDYDSVYHPDGKWLIVADLQFLKIIQAGVVFYDVTPFYSLTLNVVGWFNFEITYTKISDTIGLFYASFSLPDSLRTFQCGAASLTLPSIAVSVYTNGNWKLDVGFPKGDDWSRSFQIQCQAGPVPVTGGGGFYIASLSSATDDIFINQYPSILAFGLAARLGVGKDFTAGPLKAGISVTFFGIIEGATGYLVSGSTNIFREPDALMLSGQFGLIGQIYGSIDFVIIKASVNVTLSASIGIVLHLEKNVPGFDGSILLYVQASVSLSVSVSINLFLFSITISFSFNATFRFQWMLMGSESQAAAHLLAAASSFPRALTAPAAIPLCPGFNPAMPLWFLPEITVVFPNTTQAGAPNFVLSLGIEFDAKPPSTVTYAQFKPFEALVTQVSTLALTQALGLPAYNSPVKQSDINLLDQNPEALVGFLTYDLLVQQLAVFNKTTATVLQGTSGQNYNATSFPMPPFLQFATKGRLDGNSKPADLSYQFNQNNLVSESYLEEVDAYLNQLFVNSSPGDQGLSLASNAATIPLSQQIFLEYFSGLIRGAVHQLLQTMENNDQAEQDLDKVFCAAVGAGSIASLAGQMSSMFRGGARLPYTAGLTIPDATISTTTNPMYALLWQQFPVGTLSPVSNGATGVTSQYSVLLSNPDATQTWITATVNYALTNLAVDPFTGLTSSAITLPSAPALIPFTNTGPQSFAFTSQSTWTQPAATTASLRPLSSALSLLAATQSSALRVLVESRSAGAAYLPGGTPLAATDFGWATSIQIVAKQIPGVAIDGGTSSTPMPNVYSVSGASQADQQTLQAILEVLNTSSPIDSIQVLYQTQAGASGLTSAKINPTQVFLLRTNTTTVSAPPTQGFLLAEALADPTVSVGAQIDEPIGFLQILEQVSITNAPGYYLYYKDAAGKDLPAELFNAGPAPLTILISYKADGSQNTPASPAKVQPYYNTIVLNSVVAGLVYYAQTVDPSLDLQYTAVAPGSVGAELVRSQTSTLLKAPDGATHTRASFIHAAVANGIAHTHELHHALAAAGAAPAQLNSLYSLVTYQVAATANLFIQSNLSAPIQPQAPQGASDSAPRAYRAFVPLYALATANQQLPPDTPSNRYASIPGAYSVEFYLNDAFGNQLPGGQPFTGNNLYFDPIVPFDQWQGVVTSFDFAGAQANTVNVYLVPSEAAFTGMTTDQASAALATYSTIVTQINGPGVSFYVESNLSLAADGSLATVTLSSAQATEVRALAAALAAYLQQLAAGKQPVWNVKPVTVATVLPSTAKALAPAFEVSVHLGIQRDENLISPSLIDPENGIILPSAQNVNSAVVPGSTAQSALGDFAANFAKAFPALALTIGLGGAQQTPTKALSRSASHASSHAKARKALRANGLAADPLAASSGQGVQPLWAVSQTLLQITINSATGLPLYSSPKPLLNALESGIVPMPNTPPILAPLGQNQTFVDVDMDAINRNFFAAVDRALGPGLASSIFQANRTAYNAIALGREQLAVGYSANEVDWLFNSLAPFTGTADQLEAARENFEQQMRAELMTAYSVDTIVQFPAQWTATLPAGAAGQISLYGQVQPVGTASYKRVAGNTLTVEPGSSPNFSTAQIDVPDTGQTGLLTFTYGTSEIADVSEISVNLQLNVSHIQVYTEPASATPPGEARPSLWLQMITTTDTSIQSSLPNTLIPIGPTGTPTIIPLVFRQYPTPPTIIMQSGLGGGDSTGKKQCNFENVLTQAAAWHYTLQYQAQITAHDRLLAYISYNTETVSGNNLFAADATGPQQFTLFQSLCRFTAAYAILQPILELPADPNFSAAAGALAQLVQDVANNSDWNPQSLTGNLVASKQPVTDQYTVTDLPVQNTASRIITLTWPTVESSLPGASLAVVAIAPDGTPYPGQTPGQVPNGITDTYTATPPISSDWVAHQMEVDCLNVLTAENARPGVQIERNLIILEGTQGQSWTAIPEYVYMTPLVEAAQPVTPLLDNTTPIDVAKLPVHMPISGCPNSPASLCQRIGTILNDLLTNPTQLAARHTAASDPSSVYMLKIACGFQYPINAAANMPDGDSPIMPLVPVVLARSFSIDVSQSGQIGAFSSAYAGAIQAWASSNGILFGSSSKPTGGQLIFDVTLFAQLSGNNRPLLRLRNLQLALSDIDPSPAMR